MVEATIRVDGDGVLLSQEVVVHRTLTSGPIVHFLAPRDPGDRLSHSRLNVGMRRQDWVDMGSPETVTVTICPGDRLNADV